jgi:hypothetical protein
MDEVFLALLSSVAELLLEVFLEAAMETVVAFIIRSVRNGFEESKALSPVLAGAVYFLLGAAFGAASLAIYPHPLFRPSKFHGVNLLVSPIITGSIMSQVGSVLRRNGKESVRIESFGYGFIFALGWAVVRFIFVK